MSDKLVTQSKDPETRETVGFVKGAAAGAVGATVLLTVGFWPTVIIGGGFAAWRFSKGIRNKLSGK